MGKRLGLLLSIFMIFITIFAYRFNLWMMYELTFLSNFISGTIIGIREIQLRLNKDTKEYLILDITVLLMIVMTVTLIFSANFNMSGAMLILHVINPLLVLMYYLFRSNQKDTGVKEMYTVLVMPIIYLVFAMIFGRITGNYIYFLLDYNSMGWGFVIIFVVIIIVYVVVLSKILLWLNKLITGLKEDSTK